MGVGVGKFVWVEKTVGVGVGFFEDCGCGLWVVWVWVENFENIFYTYLLLYIILISY